MNTPVQQRHSRATATSLIVALLTLNLLFMLTRFLPPQNAEASLIEPPAEPTTTNPFNSADQRKQMINSLTQLDVRLARIEAQLAKGINVKVTEMPAIKIDSPAAKP